MSRKTKIRTGSLYGSSFPNFNTTTNRMITTTMLTNMEKNQATKLADVFKPIIFIV